MAGSSTSAYLPPATPAFFLNKWTQRFRDNDTFDITEGDLREFAGDIASAAAFLSKLTALTVRGSQLPLQTHDELTTVAPGVLVVGQLANVANDTTASEAAAGIEAGDAQYRLVRDSAGTLQAFVDARPETTQRVKVSWVKVSGSEEEKIILYPQLVLEDQMYVAGDVRKFTFLNGQTRLLEMKRPLPQPGMGGFNPDPNTALGLDDDTNPDYRLFSPLAGGVKFAELQGLLQRNISWTDALDAATRGKLESPSTLRIGGRGVDPAFEDGRQLPVVIVSVLNGYALAEQEAYIENEDRSLTPVSFNLSTNQHTPRQVSGSGTGGVTQAQLMGAIDHALAPILAIIGSAGGDADNVVNTVRDVLTVMQHYPEGVELLATIAALQTSIEQETTARLAADLTLQQKRQVDALTSPFLGPDPATGLLVGYASFEDACDAGVSYIRIQKANSVTLTRDVVIPDLCAVYATGSLRLLVPSGIQLFVDGSADFYGVYLEIEGSLNDGLAIRKFYQGGLKGVIPNAGGAEFYDTDLSPAQFTGADPITLYGSTSDPLSIAPDLLHDRRPGTGGPGGSRELSFRFPAGSADYAEEVVGRAYAGSYGTVMQSGTTGIAYTKNGSPVTLPFTLAAGDTLRVDVTRTGAALVELNA